MGKKRRTSRDEPEEVVDEEEFEEEDLEDEDLESEDVEEEDEEESDVADEEEEEEPEPEVVEPDHQDAVAALRDIGARLDVNDNGNVWRIFFYEKHTDKDLDQIHGLPALKELWLLTTKITSNGANAVRERLDKATVHYG